MRNQVAMSFGTDAQLTSRHVGGARVSTLAGAIIRVWLVFALALATTTIMAPATAARGASARVSPPPQPASGPGSSTYPFNGVQADRFGSMPTGSTVFSPEGMKPDELADLPVIVFLHGFTAVEPQRYGGWIRHLVRRGAVVIYPDYQNAGVFAGGQDRYIENMFAGIEEALDALGSYPSHVHVTGHSLGAVLAMVYGLTSAERDLPLAASLTLIEPGGCRNCGNSIGFGVPLPLDGTLPDDTLVSIVAGDDDTLVGTSDARVLAEMVSTIPPDQRRFLVVRGDDRGQPPLVADHLFPQTAGRGGEEDSLDWYGLWRPLDALVSCADTGRECEVALGTSGDALFMGTWSDGIPVATPSVQDAGGPR